MADTISFPYIEQIIDRKLGPYLEQINNYGKEDMLLIENSYIKGLDEQGKTEEASFIKQVINFARNGCVYLILDLEDWTNCGMCKHYRNSILSKEDEQKLINIGKHRELLKDLSSLENQISGGYHPFRDMLTLQINDISRKVLGKELFSDSERFRILSYGRDTIIVD